MVKELSHHQATTLYVDFDHVQTFSSETANAILLEYYR